MHTHAAERSCALTQLTQLSFCVPRHPTPLLPQVGISPVCILGVNINAGQEVSLRLRTDDLKGAPGCGGGQAEAGGGKWGGGVAA